MLSERETQFIQYWEQVREKQNSFLSKMLGGLPMALIFALPILLFLAVVNIFFPEWYTKVSDVSQGSLVMVVIAVFICVLFFSYFRMQFKWERNEQYYKELKSKETVKKQAE